MSLRETEAYKKMTPYTATGLAEGFVEPDEGDVEEQEEQVLAAWQYLHDSKLAYQLQGWFGRTVTALIEAGHVEA